MIIERFSDNVIFIFIFIHQPSHLLLLMKMNNN